MKKEVGSLLSDTSLDYTIDEVAGQDWWNKVAEIKNEWE
ncbi:hypothetical protein RV08_GL002454 [Enterococcus mundtii]|nr:hypothetical protein RV08_GL002454 [Enterococcus mundtii]